MAGQGRKGRRHGSAGETPCGIGKRAAVALDRATAIHEAGHAVARYLRASDFGFPPEEAISHIHIADNADMGRSV